MRRFLSLLAICMLARSFASGQRNSSEDANKLSSESILKVASEVEVRDVSETFLTLPVMCADKTTYVRLTDGENLSELTSITSDGKKVIRFSTDKITDVINPQIQTFFVSSTGVYLLILSSVPQDHVLTLGTPHEPQTQQRAVLTRQFVARFSPDGSYLGSVPIELPFHPHQFGVFPNGDFLFAGLSKAKEATVALVKSSGQFNRFVEIPGDIYMATDTDSRASPAQVGALPAHGKNFGEGFAEAAMVSNIVADGARLLLLRKVTGLPIFTISAGGDVHAITVHGPPGFNLFDLKPAQNVWIIVFARKSADKGLAIETLAVNSETGDVVRKYSYPRFPGVALGCVDIDALTFIQNVNDKMRLVTLAAQSINPD